MNGGLQGGGVNLPVGGVSLPGGGVSLPGGGLSLPGGGIAVPEQGMMGPGGLGLHQSMFGMPGVIQALPISQGHFYVNKF